MSDFNFITAVEANEIVNKNYNEEVYAGLWNNMVESIDAIIRKQASKGNIEASIRVSLPSEFSERHTEECLAYIMKQITNVGFACSINRSTYNWSGVYSIKITW